MLCPNATSDELNYIQNGLTISEFKPRHFYLQANTIQKEIGFVVSGLLRTFHVDNKGNEITVNFIGENRYATDYSAFITQTPCKYYIQCIEPCIIVNISYQHIHEGYVRFPHLEKYGRLIAERILQIQQKRIESFLFDNAETRYLKFITENPNLINRVSLTYLSSYLGIKRQSLTRIRKKLHHDSF